MCAFIHTYIHTRTGMIHSSIDPSIHTHTHVHTYKHTYIYTHDAYVLTAGKACGGRHQIDEDGTWAAGLPTAEGAEAEGQVLKEFLLCVCVGVWECVFVD
jgi:hypothetical protein